MQPSYEAQEVLWALLAADEEPPEVPQPGEQAVHLPAPLVTSQLAFVVGFFLFLRCGAIISMPACPKLGVERVGGLSPIGGQPLGFAGSETGFDGLLDEDDLLVRRSTRRVHEDRNTRAVCNRRELFAHPAMAASCRGDSVWAPSAFAGVV